MQCNAIPCDPQSAGHESPLFLSYFREGITYEEGGVASGFRHVDRVADYVNKLYRCKGSRIVRVQVWFPFFSCLFCFGIVRRIESNPMYE